MLEPSFFPMKSPVVLQQGGGQFRRQLFATQHVLSLDRFAREYLALTMRVPMMYVPYYMWQYCILHAYLIHLHVYIHKIVYTYTFTIYILRIYLDVFNVL